MKNRSGLYFLTAILFVFVIGLQETHAYVLKRKENGGAVKWGANSNIKLNLNTTNSSNISESDVLQIFNNSVNEWSNKANVSFSTQQVSGTLSGRNDIYFTKSSSLGTGILAITTVSFDSASGKLIEADIKINDSVTFNTTEGSSTEYQYYLGDVLTHELGHLLGLDHSQTFGSTMIFTIFKDQSKIKSDDKAGLIDLYSTNSSTYGSLSGTVVGGNLLIGVFGVYVQAISAKTGKVVGGNFSETNGSFTIYGLPIDDTYYLYLSPRRKSASLPDYYTTAQDNFCIGGSYKESFYTKCSYFDEGYPQGIQLSSTEKNINVGNVTIKCGLNTNQEYLDKKADQYTFEVPMYDSNSLKTVGNAVVGSFATSEIGSLKKDTFQIDLRSLTSNTSYTANDLASDDGLYLDVKFLSQYLFSNVKAKITISNYENGGTVSQNFEVNSSDNDLNLNFRVKLDSDATKNLFKVKVYPQTISDDSLYFPSINVFKTSVPLYLLIVNVSKKTGDSYGIDYMRSYKPYEDNSSCSDASKTFAVGAYTYGVADSKKTEDKKKFLGVGAACGSIDLNGGGSSGGGMMMLNNLLGFLLIIVFQYSRKKVGEPFKKLLEK